MQVYERYCYPIVSNIDEIAIRIVFSDSNIVRVLYGAGQVYRHSPFLTGGVPLEAPGLVSFLGWTVLKSQRGPNKTRLCALDRHHPTETLETVRFDVSNVPRGLLGLEISQVGGRPSWPSGVPGEAT
jgi:hypothetical protein